MGRGAGPARAEDVWALVGIVVVSALCLVVGLRTGVETVDVDELVYMRTLAGMRGGQSYYDATADALAAKEGAPPSQLRSVRPPTVYLALAVFPSDAWRWLATVAQAATLLLAWRIGRSRWPLGGPLAVGAVGFWMVAAAPFLYLHAELWGLPLALGGVLAMRRGWWVWAAVAFGAAACTRELYLPFLVAGLVFTPAKRWAWVVSTGVVAALAVVHSRLVAAILDPAGREAAFGRGRSLSAALSSISPADRPMAWTIGLAGTVLGGWVLWRLARAPGGRPELIVGVSASILLAVTLVWGRAYWGLTFGPVLACYAVMAPTLWSHPVWRRLADPVPAERG